MIDGVADNIALAKAWARRLSLVYVGVLGLWVMVQGGIPMAPYLDIVIEQSVWLQTLAGLVFAASLSWLLYLLLAKGLALIAHAQSALQMLDRAIQSSVNAVLVSEYRAPDYPIVYANRAFERITGYARAEVLGRGVPFLRGDDRAQPELEGVVAALAGGRAHRAVLRSYRKDGGMYWAEVHVAPVSGAGGRVTHVVTVLDDISEARRYQEALERHANYDDLTGLANRNLLTDRIGHAIARCERYKGRVALMVVGLDNFSLVRDGLEHAVGNDVLCAVAARLRSRFRTVDTLARPGADEFALLLADHSGVQSIAGQIQRVREVFSHPFPAGEREVHVTAGIGVALFPEDAGEPEALLKRAEIAMHRARELAPDGFAMFAAEMASGVLERVALENDLRGAIERQELELYYQPRVELPSGRIGGAEALLRWHHPRRGAVPPGWFIPLAEETGLILPIGNWALRRACAQILEWQRAGYGPVCVSVNLSALQLRQPGLARTVGDLLREFGLDPRSLELEITESAVMRDVESAAAILREIKAMGLRLAIDDFGTGYSSLAYLRRFPVDVLKVDQSFVRGCDSDADGAAIVGAVIALARSLGMRVVAEGVETAAQRAFLVEQGCDEVQGYLTGRPMPAAEFGALINGAIGAAR